MTAIPTMRHNYIGELSVPELLTKLKEVTAAIQFADEQSHHIEHTQDWGLIRSALVERKNHIANQLEKRQESTP